MNNKNIITSAITSIVTLSLFLSVLFLLTKKETTPNLTDNVPAQSVKLLPNNSYGTINLVDAAEKSLNTVVHIKTESTQEGAIAYNPLGELFFGTPFQKQPDKKLSGSGSGVIISADGYIATNYHVIKDADKIEISLNDNRNFKAILIGSDPNTDLALLKIDEINLPAIKYGNSDDVKIGQWVLAVGNPFNLTSTVTAGIVSAKGRNINLLKEQYAIESFIQTDAAVNPGNSGGALVNTEGELIGINTAIASNTGSYTGYSFAVPVNLVKKVMADLRDYGKVQRALLGVKIQDIDQELITKLALSNSSGAYIAEVYENSAADDGKLKKGDIIISINGNSVSSSANLQEQISQYGPGDKIKVEYIRKNNSNIVTVTLRNPAGTLAVLKNESFYLGANFKELTDDEKKVYSVKNGIKIDKINNGKLKKEGVKEGFIITHLDKTPIDSPEQFINLIQNKKGGVLIEGVYPNGSKAYYGFGL